MNMNLHSGQLDRENNMTHPSDLILNERTSLCTNMKYLNIEKHYREQLI